MHIQVMLCPFLLSSEEVHWNSDWFSSRKSAKYWSRIELQRQFLDQLGNKFGITKMQDWGNIPPETLFNYGGRTLLRNFNFSMYRMFSSIYPGTLIIVH